MILRSLLDISPYYLVAHIDTNISEKTTASILSVTKFASREHYTIQESENRKLSGL